MLDIINIPDNQIVDDKVVVNVLYDPMRPDQRKQYLFNHEPFKMLDYYLPMEQEEGIVVAINGEIIQGRWEKVFVHPGDKIAVTSEYGVTVATFFAWAFSNFAFAAGLGVGFQTFAWGLGYVVGYMAVMYSVSYLVNALLASDAQDVGSGADHEQSPTYTWGALRPVYTEGNPIQIGFGTNKVAGQVLNQYTEVGDNNESYLNMLLAVGYGEATSISDIQINGRDADDFKGVTTYTCMGDNNGTAFPNFNAIYTHHAYSYKESGSGTEITTDGNSVERIEIDLTCPNGCYYSNDEGGITAQSATFSVSYRANGDSAWTLSGNYSISGATTDAVRKKVTIPPIDDSPNVLSPDKYDIKIVRTNTEISSYRGNNDLYVVAMREVIEEALTYPGIAKYAIRALATDQLSGTAPSITCITAWNTVSIYDEDALPSPAWVDKAKTNPAWATWGLLVHHGRYTYDQLDWNVFSDWADFCDTNVSTESGVEEKQAVINTIIDVEGNVWDKANDIAKYGRAKLYRNGSKISVFVDKEESTVSHLFTMGNIIEDSFILQYLPMSDRANCIEITYTDPDRGYDRKIVQVKSSEYEDSTTKSRKTSISYTAALPRNQVIRDAAYRLNSNKWLIRAVEFNVDIEAFACVIGDLFYFQHDVPDYDNGSSGRVVSAEDISGSGFVTIDHEVSLDDGESYSIIVRLDDDTIVEKTIAGLASGEESYVKLKIDDAGHFLDIDSLGNDLIIDTEPVIGTVLELTTPWTTPPSQYCPFAFGKTSLYKKTYRLTNVSRQSDQIMCLTGLEYISDIYDEQTDYVIEDPIWEQREQEAAGVWLNEYLVYAKDGGYQSNIGVTWHPAYSIDPVKWDVWIKDLTAEQVDGLVGSWLFNEGMGLIAYDSSGEGNDSTLVNTPTWTSNENGFALDFDGVDQYARTETIETIFGSSNVNTLSVSFWAKANDAPINLDSMLGSGNNSLANGFGVMWSSSTVARFFINNYSDNFAYAEGLTATDWNHFVGVYDGSTIKLYVNTVIGGVTDTYSDDIADPSLYVDIGQIYNSTYNFDGLIDEVRIYNKALSVSEIEDLYALRPISFTKVAETDNLHVVISAPWLVVGNEYQIAVTPSGTGPINTGGNHASIKLWGKLAPPSDVATFNGTWNSVTRSIEFSWGKVADIDLSHYEIREGNDWDDSPSNVVIEHATGTTDTLYIGEGVSETRTYWIKAVDKSGIYSDTALDEDVAIDTSECPLSIPTGLSLSSSSTIYSDGQDRAELRATWDANAETSDYFHHYEVELEHISSGHISEYYARENLYHWELPPNTQYGVRVRAVSMPDGNFTSWCLQETQTTAKDANAPSAPTWPEDDSPATGTNIVAGFKVIGLSWNDNTEDDLAYYEVERSTDGNFTGEEESLGKALKSFMTDSGLAVSTQYWYRVRAFDSSGNYSDWSTIKTTTTTQVGQTDIAANSIIASHINVSTLSAIVADVGTLTAGILKSASYDDSPSTIGMYIDLDNDIFRAGGADNPFFEMNGASVTIDGTVISNGSIDTDQLAADAVTAAKIDVTNLNSVSANTGALTVDGKLSVGDQIELGSGGFINSIGKTSYADTDAGFWLGEDDTESPAIHKLNIGDADYWMKWTGTFLDQKARDMGMRAGDILWATDDDEETQGINSYSKLKEFTIGRGGEMRIKFTMTTDTDTYGRIYRNGAAVGTEQQGTGSGAGGFDTFSEDIDGWEPGDQCQLYGKYFPDPYAPTATFKNFRLYTDEGFGAIITA